VNGWTGSLAVSYQTAHRTFAEPVAIPETSVAVAIDALTAMHGGTFTSNNISVVRGATYRHTVDGPEGVLLQLQVAAGGDWLAPSYDPVVLMTADGGVLMSLQPTSGFRRLADINGDGIDEIVIGNKDSGADLVWSGDPSARTPLPIDVRISLKYPFIGEFAVSNAEAGEFTFFHDGSSDGTIYHLQASEAGATLVTTTTLDFNPRLILGNPEHPAPQPLFANQYDQPITQFLGSTSTTIVGTGGDTQLGNPSRFAQFDGVGGYDLIQLSIDRRAWMAAPDGSWLVVDVPTAEGTGDGEYAEGLFAQDLDGDGRAEFVSASSGIGDTYYQKIWWNNTE